MKDIAAKINELFDNFTAQGVLDIIKLIVDKIFAFIREEEEIPAAPAE
jgi:hypothetical protein